MRRVTLEEIQAMKGNGSSMRTVLKHFINKGAEVYVVHENIGTNTERYFLVKYENLEIPLRAFNLNFYSVYNSHLARSITADKLNSAAMLQAWNIPQPDTLAYTDLAAAEAFLNEHSVCVVKPRNGAHGDGITTGVTDKEALERAIAAAQAIDTTGQVLLQQQVSGHDHRLLFIDYKFVAAVKRLPASIVGDGTQTIRQIVESSNARISALWQDIRSGVADADATRGSISKTPIAEIVAARGEAFLDKIPGNGETVQLLDKANVSLGGQTQDVTDQVHSELTAQLSTFLKKIELPLCGVDVLSTDISSSPDQNLSFVIELNAAPGLRLHELPTEGQSRPVCAMVADSLIQYYRNER